MTTRAMDPDPALMFSRGRSDTLRFATMTVTTPPAHQSGQIERSETLPPDPALYFAIQNPALLDGDQGFLRAFNAEIRSRPAGQRGVMVFIHGFNTTLTDAVLGIAQFVEDTGFTGVPLLFSWASGGRVQDYVYDINSVLAARDDLLHGAVLVSKSGATSVDLVAHSMGNLLAVEAMRQAKLEGTFTKLGKLHNVILASPDIDVDLFRRQLSVFSPDERRFYVFISRGDTALRASRFIGGGVPRVGAGDVKALAM